MQTALKLESEDEFQIENTTLVSLVPGILNIGRATENDVVIDAPDINQHHAKIVTYFRESFLIDLSSESGTLLNGEHVSKHSIRPGDVITVGNHHIVVNAAVEWFY